MNSYEHLMAQIEKKREAKRASDLEVARLTGQTIGQFDADTTAPDTHQNEQE